MAKTIKELSTDYAFDNCNKESEFFLVEEAYQAGAKAVLKEVEKQIEQVKYYSDTSATSMLYKNLVKTIKELKD